METAFGGTTTTATSDTPLCRECYDDHYTDCADCGRLIRQRDAFYFSSDSDEPYIFSVYIARGRQPADHVVGKDIPFMTPGATVFANSVNYDATLNANPVYYHSVLPYWEMDDDGKITKLEMLPVELNMSDVPGLKGYPAPCDPSLVLDDLRKASAEYGTEFFVNDKGLIEVKL